MELPGKEKKKVYYSTLVKAPLTKAVNSSEEVLLDQVYFCDVKILQNKNLQLFMLSLVLLDMQYFLYNHSLKKCWG